MSPQQEREIRGKILKRIERQLRQDSYSSCFWAAEEIEKSMEHTRATPKAMNQLKECQRCLRDGLRSVTELLRRLRRR